MALGLALGKTLAESVVYGEVMELGPELEYRMALSTLSEMRETSIRKCRAPPVGVSWDRLDRWQLCLAGKWHQEEHNNIGECRSVNACLRHAARSRENWNRRLLCISDSLVAIGVLAKGRSSTRGLLRQARVAAGYQFGLNIRLVVRFTPSGRNLADGPSRQTKKIGVKRKRIGARVRVPGWV